MKTKTTKTVLMALVAIMALSACDLLTVSDPQRYTVKDLYELEEGDDPDGLRAVARGVEGAVHNAVDVYVVYQALLSDVYQHTGTWSGYDEVDHGRFLYGTSPMNSTQNAWLRAQWFAVEAEDRFKQQLDEGNISVALADQLTAQVRLAGGIADMYLGMGFCESVGEASGSAMTDQQMLQQAVQKLTGAMETAQSAGRLDYAMAAQAGRAQAKLILGDYSGAAADAATIPAGFSYDAVFNQSSNNWVVVVTTKLFNEAAGLMHKWWDQIDISDDPGYMRDPWTNEYDMRIPVYFDGEIATDNVTPHYSQWKYNGFTDAIPIVHSDAMRLIEAEAMVASGNFDEALGVLNGLRSAVGLSPLEPTTDRDMMLDYLLSERFAELFMEGQRALDLHRFGLTKQIFDDLGDPERPGSGRPTKFPLTSTEAVYNDKIDDNQNQRCLPSS